MKIKTLNLLCAASISLMLAACGGSSDESLLDDQKDKSNSSSSTASTTSSSISSAIGADTLQTISFSTVLPSEINLKGTGGAESSLVTFRVLGKTGLPIKDIDVSFVLNTTVGGLALSQSSSKSDADGYVSTNVISGTIPTTISVTATAVSDPSISTQSSLLVVATGLPDQKSMSIAVAKFNQATWQYNGIETTISVLLADAYNNPVTDDTAVYFTTEGGSIESNCPTVGGGCSVKWKSQDPRPQRADPEASVERILCIGPEIIDTASLHACEAARSGRITIQATASGNESYKDINSNGIFEVGDLFKTDGNCLANVPISSFDSTTGACDDLSEAYLDKNESGTRDPDEPFNNVVIEVVNDALPDNYTKSNGIYNGAFCPARAGNLQDEEHGFCSRKSVTIRRDTIIVMSCDYPLLGEDGFLPKLGGSYILADCNGNALPVGTKVTIGTNPDIVLGNGINWTTLSAPAGADIKLTIPVGADASNTKILHVVGN